MKCSTILTIACVNLLGACSLGPVRQVRLFKASDFAGYEVKRVVVFPFADQSDSVSGEPLFALHAAFVREMRKRSPYEVVQLPRETMLEVEASDPAKTGEYQVEALIAVGRRFRADAIVFGRVTAARSYYPQTLGLRTEMVSTKTGATLWEVDAMYDAGDRDVENAVRLHFEKEVAHYTESEDWRTILLSPSRFAGFVASRCVEAVWAPMPEKRPAAAVHVSER